MIHSGLSTGLKIVSASLYFVSANGFAVADVRVVLFVRMAESGNPAGFHAAYSILSGDTP
jgi:hypothetical protein